MPHRFLMKKLPEETANNLSTKLCICLYCCPIDLFFFIYNVSDSMLDVVLRPNIPQIVCFSMYPDHISLCRTLDNTTNFIGDVQKEATNYIIYLKCLSSFPALLMGLFCGAWSDKYGRKLPMILPCVGSTLAIFLYLLANVSTRSSTAFFLCGSLIHGCFGKTSLISMAVHSYIVDITDSNDRIHKLGLLAAMRFLGTFVGSLIAGILLDNVSILYTYCTASIMNSIVVIFTITVLPETTGTNEGVTLFPCRTICSIDHFKDSLNVLIRERKNNVRVSVCVILFIGLLHQACRTGLTDVTLLYTELPPLSWPPSWFGYLVSVDNVAMGVVLLIVLPILSNCLCLSDSTICIIGLTGACLRYLILAFSRHNWLVWVAVGVGSLGGLTHSPIRSILSKLVHEDEVGKIFSVLGTGETIAKFLALAFTAFYGITIDVFPGMAFLLASGIFTMMTLLILFVHKSTKQLLQQCSDKEESILVSDTKLVSPVK